MKDEVILAAVLLAATGVLLILTIIMICIVFKSVKYQSRRKAPEIPSFKPSQHNDNHGVPGGTSAGVYNDSKPDKAGRLSYYSNDAVEDHKAEWPQMYNMYAVSRSYAFPKAAEKSSAVGSRATPSSQASSFGVSTAREVHHKTFSEEVFEGINSATVATSSEPANQDSGAGVWKYRAPSETASQHSRDTPSMQGSTVSQSREQRVVEQRSYYSSFKPRNTSVSTETSSQVTEISNRRSSGITRERITTHSVKSTGTQKVFTFNLS